MTRSLKYLEVGSFVLLIMDCSLPNISFGFDFWFSTFLFHYLIIGLDISDIFTKLSITTTRMTKIDFSVS